MERNEVIHMKYIQTHINTIYNMHYVFLGTAACRNNTIHDCQQKILGKHLTEYIREERGRSQLTSHNSSQSGYSLRIPATAM